MSDEAHLSRRKRPNSPKAPGISLRAAVAEVGKAYQRYSHGTFSRGELASALGMSAGSGSFLTKIAALKDYGLVEETGAELKVSELFKAIHQAPGGSAELKRNALAAIQHASVFGRLLQQFAAKVPDTSALSLRLENQDRFNRDRAGVVATAFRASLTEYGLVDGTGNVLPVRESSEPQTTSVEASDGASAQFDVSLAEDTDRFRIEVPLGPGRRAVMLLPEDLSDADVKRMTAVLEAYVS